MTNTLTIQDAVALADVIGFAQRSARVRWLANDRDLLEGTARSIGDERGAFLRSDEDVRDAYLRITTLGGFEVFMPVRDAIRLVQRGEMAEDAR